MSEKELLKLCVGKNDCIVPKFAPFWTSEIYGFGKYIRKYGYYPSFLPLAVYTDHAPGRISNKPWRHELESSAPTMFYHSPESVLLWNEFSKKPCFTLFSPFVFYRKTNNITQNLNATGTIVFPDHTIPSMTEMSDTQSYIDQLKKLPEKFQPVSVCLHHNDIKIGRHKIYIKNKIPLYTAGSNHKYFIERYYDILRKFKYASSNEVCSSLYYAIEMGIPFFIYGKRPENINISDTNLPKGKWDIQKGNKYNQKLFSMFSNTNIKITLKNRGLVERDLGVYDGVSRVKMMNILYTSLFRWIFSKSFFQEYILVGILYLVNKTKIIFRTK